MHPNLRLVADKGDAGSSAPPPLHSYDGGGTSGGMDAVDAKIAAAEARTDTKFAQMMGELRRIDEQTRGTKVTVIGTGIAVLALVIGAMAWGGQMFGNGLTAQPIAAAAVAAAQSKTDTQFADMNARYDKLDDRMSGIEAHTSAILEAVQKNAAPPAAQ